MQELLFNDVTIALIVGFIVGLAVPFEYEMNRIREMGMAMFDRLPEREEREEEE